jgi:hypothetical protein
MAAAAPPAIMVRNLAELTELRHLIRRRPLSGTSSDAELVTLRIGGHHPSSPVPRAELLDRIAGFHRACVAFTKQLRMNEAKRARFRDVLDRSPGFPARALPELEWLLPYDDEGQVPVVGPSSPAPAVRLPALRAVGYRRVGSRLAPILHAKLLLLGELTWLEDEEYGTGEFLRFKPERLWVGSANGTHSSRSSLEFGCWLEDWKLLENARQFLAEVLRHSIDREWDKPGRPSRLAVRVD